MTAERNSELIDQLLAQEVIRGDRGAVEAFYQRFRTLVQGIAWKFTPHAEDTKDLEQEMWVQLFLVLPRWQPFGALGGWVTTVAVNKALEWRRQREKRADKLGREIDFEPADDASDPAGEAEQREIQDALLDCVERIAHVGQRQALQLTLQQYTYEEIAAILEKPIETIGTWIRRGKAAVKKCLEQKFPEIVKENTGIVHY